MADTIKMDFSELRAFFARLHQAASGDFKKELATFMDGLGMEFLRVVQDEIIRRNVVDTRLLLNSFERGGAENVWVVSDGGLRLEVGTNVEYAKYVNYGHWTCSEGEIGRFIPGEWNGDKFKYNPSAKTGMYLKQQWVEGKHYWENALRIIEKMFPDFLEVKFEEWVLNYLDFG